MIPVAPAGAAASGPSPLPSATGAERSFGTVLEGLSRPEVSSSVRSGGLETSPRIQDCPSHPGGTHLLEVVDQARARLDGVLAAARSGRTFTAQELLGLQAEAYRTVQTIDLGVKLVEQGAQAVRQALGTQV